MEYIVTFKDVRGEVKVDAVDRWDAVCKACEKMKLLGEGKPPVSGWFDIACVRKVERKKRKTWWER